MGIGTRAHGASGGAPPSPLIVAGGPAVGLTPFSVAVGNPAIHLEVLQAGSLVGRCGSPGDVLSRVWALVKSFNQGSCVSRGDKLMRGQTVSCYATQFEATLLPIGFTVK